MKSVDKDFWH